MDSKNGSYYVDHLQFCYRYRSTFNGEVINPSPSRALFRARCPTVRTQTLPRIHRGQRAAHALCALESRPVITNSRTNLQTVMTGSVLKHGTLRRFKTMSTRQIVHTPSLLDRGSHQRCMRWRWQRAPLPAHRRRCAAGCCLVLIHFQ